MGYFSLMSKSKKLLADPFSKREAAKYPNPIPSREYIMSWLENSGKLLSRNQLAVDLQITDEEQLVALYRRLRAMERDGQLIRNRRGAYGLVTKMDLVSGTVVGHKDGYAWLLADKSSQQLYLSPRHARGVFDGDRALARAVGTYKGRQEGAIVEVLEHNTHTLVGHFYQDHRVAYITPCNPKLNQDILLAADPDNQAKTGQLALVEITKQPSLDSRPQGQIVKWLVNPLTSRQEIDMAIYAHNLPHQWPLEVEQEIKQINRSITPEEISHRIDLRQLPFVTIDGEDAQDFDDAVLCQAKPKGGWRLFVAIADVGYYVPAHSSLDKEAQRRGTSIYFPDHVLPMLPELLANDLCSLKPRVDRLCLVCEMQISAQGRLSRYQFYPAVIHSQARLTYTQVSAMLEQPHTQSGQRCRQTYAQLLPHLENLRQLYQGLSEARKRRGSIDFDTVETRVIFDAQQQVKKVVPVSRNLAHRLIEEAMLCANVAAARFLSEHKLPALYRVHEAPKAEKITEVRAFLGELGLTLGTSSKPSSKDYQRLLQQIAERQDASLIQIVLLRSLNQAQYTAENKGHFGLGYPAYSHFTSPIRRYPDLLTHRALRYVIHKRGNPDHVLKPPGIKPVAKARIYPYTHQEIQRLGMLMSHYERRGDEASRDVISRLKCQYMLQRLGKKFNGMISAVTGFGLFVQLADIYIDGLVHITALPNDYYHLHKTKQKLVGERTGTCFALGESLSVIVARVDVEEKKIDLELAGSISKASGRHKKKPAKARQRKKP
jgi:ribonuclease R